VYVCLVSSNPHATLNKHFFAEDEREAALYYLLARHPGRALVFVNAVSALRRVAAVLKLLGLPAQALHAQQQQRQRLKVRTGRGRSNRGCRLGA
jgi:superfamily II DNA/RNA helicase